MLMTQIKAFAVFLLLTPTLFSSETAVDSHQWLEEMESPKTQEWIEKQNVSSLAYLKACPDREKIKNHLRAISDYEDYGLPVERDNGLFFFMREKGEELPKLAFKTSNGVIRVLVTPDLYAPLSGFEVSEDGKFLAYGVSNAGADEQVWHFLNVETGETLKNEIHGIKFTSPVWSPDNQTVYYVLHDETAVYAHDIQSEENRLLFPLKSETTKFLFGLTDVSEKTLLVHALNGFSRNNAVFLLDTHTLQVQEIVPFEKGQFIYMGKLDKKLLFLSDDEANRNKLLVYEQEWLPFIPESVDTLIDATVVNHTVVCHYLKECVATLKRFDQKGQFLDEVSLPGKGSIGLADRAPFFAYTDVATPRAIYHFETGVYFEPKAEKLTGTITKQLFFKSKDGTRVPLFITHKKGLKKTGNHPTLLYGYGGFNIPLTPSYSPLIATWLEQGGIFVTVNLRGGGEFGKEWHEAGMKENKQNVFDDFIAAAEFLIESGYTNSSKLAINGHSNGGLLVGACLLQRPDLFGAAIPQVGVLDMLKFHQYTIGWSWKSDYGNPDDPEDLTYLQAYSPYHNIKAGTHYPPTLITTADHDDRVVPLHSYKFAARLQENQEGKNPILLRVYTKTGHGRGRSLEQSIEERTDILSFLIQTLGLNEN